MKYLIKKHVTMTLISLFFNTKWIIKLSLGNTCLTCLPNFGCPFFNEIALLAYKDASLLKQSLLLYLQKCSVSFSTQLLPLDVIALTLSRKPGETLFTFCAVFTCNYLPLSTRLTKLLRFKLNQITRKKSERTSLTMLLRWEIFFQAYQETLVKPGLPCFYSEVGDFNLAYQENLVEPGLQCF